MTDQEAKQFIQDLVSKVFEKNQQVLLRDYYSKDVIVHVNDQVFNFQDVLNRLDYLHKRYRHIKYHLYNLVVADEGGLLVGYFGTSAYDTLLREFCNCDMVSVYLLENKLIKEAWLMFNQELNYAATLGDFYQGLTSQESLTVGSLERKGFEFIRQAISQANKHYHAQFTDRELESLFYYLKGFTAKEIARVMNISPRTVEAYMGSIKKKYHCASKRELRQKVLGLSVRG